MPRAILCVGNGDPSLPLGAGVLELSPNHPSPSPMPGYLKILVSASSVNFADPLTVEGKYQVKIPTPFVPGSEASGTVVEVGSRESSFKPGDRVVSFHQGGAYADEMLVPELTTWKVPQGVDLTTSAAVPVVYGTADLALRHRAGIRQGQTVLVLGAGGGVGLAAVQISKVLGAKVVAVTQGAAKVAFLQSQGAEVVIDLAHTTKDRPLSILVKQHIPKGVNVVIDPVGGTLFNEALRSVAWGAHIVVIGFAGGGIPKVTTLNGRSSRINWNKSNTGAATILSDAWFHELSCPACFVAVHPLHLKSILTCRYARIDVLSSSFKPGFSYAAQYALQEAGLPNVKT